MRSEPLSCDRTACEWVIRRSPPLDRLPTRESRHSPQSGQGPKRVSGRAGGSKDRGALTEKEDILSARRGTDLEISRCGWEMGPQNLVQGKRKLRFGQPQGKTPGFICVCKERAKIPSRPCGQSGGYGLWESGWDGEEGCRARRRCLWTGRKAPTPNLRLPHSVAGLPSGLGLPCCLRS